MKSRSGKFSRRNFLKLTGSAAALTALAACTPVAAPAGGGGGGAAEPAEAKTLRFWMWNTFAPGADEVMQEKLEAWGADNGVTIEISRDADGNQQTKVMPSLEAGTLPDALFVNSGTALLMKNAGGTTNLTDSFKEIGDAHGGWQTNSDKYVMREGEVHFMPYSIDTPMTFFRTDWMEEAGVTIPSGQWTWDQTRDIALQVQQYTEGQGAKKNGWGFGVVKQQHDAWCQDIFRNFGADIWDESGEKIILADEKAEEAIRALNFAKEAWDAGLFPDDAASWDWGSNNKSFQEDQGFLVINAASIFVWSTENRPELAEVTGLAPKPKDMRDTTDAGLRYTTAITSQAADPALALDLVTALYEPDIYVPWLEAGFVTNVLKEYDSLEMWEGQRGAFNLAAQIGVYPGYPAPFDNAAQAELNGPNEPTGSMMVRVLLDGKSPEEAIDEADTFAKRVFEKYF